MSAERCGARPPAFAVWLVSRVVPEASRATVLGDLHERFLARVERDGQPAARRWYWRQTLAFATRLPATRATRHAEDLVTQRRRRPVGLVADVRLAVRSLKKRPGLSVTAVLILAIAVGANTTVFSIVDAVLLQRLPYPEPDRLVMLWDRYPDSARMGDQSPITLDHVRLWTEQDDLFAGVGAFESTSMAFEEGGWPERLDGAQVTAALLPMLGARPHLGRLIAPEDEAAGADPVVVLSYELWQTRFGGAPDTVGRLVDLSGHPTRVVGVIDDGFWFYDPYSVSRSLSGHSASAARFWTPLPRAPQWEGAEAYPAYRVIARLRPGLALDAARDTAAARRLAMPPTSSESSEAEKAEVLIRPLDDQVLTSARPRLLGLFAAVSLVLLVACVNLVGLLLVHLDSRRSEFAVRVAMGAGRGRLARQLVVESGVLALIGAAAGLFLAHVATGWLVNLVPRGLPLAHRVQLDAGVVAFGVGLSLAAGIAISLAASWRLNPRRLAAAMSTGPRTLTSSRGSRRLHSVLVATEVALSLVLLVTATLLLRSLVGLHTADTGFDARGVLTFEAVMIENDDESAPGDFLGTLRERLPNLPGVAAAGATSALPFSRWAQYARATTGSESDAGLADRFIDHRLITPGYFEAIGLPVVDGRSFDASDRPDTQPVAIVNEAFLERRLPSVGSAIGRSITITRGRNSVEHTIVGVVANVKHDRLFEVSRPIIYVRSPQGFLPMQRFAVRVEGGDPLALVEPIRRAALEIDPSQPLQQFMTLEQLIGQSIEEETFYAQVLAGFAATAVVLTLVGIYGVVSFTTRQRNREIALRMALGAGSGQVRRLILGQGLLPVGIGLVLGCLVALGTGRLVSGLLHGIAPQDAVSFVAATVLFAGVAAAACLIPAARASRVDPMGAMRGT